MPVLAVTHTTTYRYANPVRFGEHRMMMRPRDSHDLRLIETSLLIRPAARIRWIHDVFSNSVAIARFSEPASELRVVSKFQAEHFPLAEGGVEIEEYARRHPFSYDASEVPDIGRTAERHYPDPEHKIDAWARRFVEGAAEHDTMSILAAMTRTIQAEFKYNPRDEMGTQDPVTTLNTRTGTCRDYALFMMEAARTLGFAARFVSGYLYDDTKIDHRRNSNTPPGDSPPAGRLTGGNPPGASPPGASPVAASLPAASQPGAGPPADRAAALGDSSLRVGDSAIEAGEPALIGGGVTHAWLQIYLPGAGWVPFDPTNGLISDRNLIRVAVTRDPSQAVPLKGSFIGGKNDFLGMEVTVEITA